MPQQAIAIIGPDEGRTYNVLGAQVRVCSSGRADQLLFADHPVPAGYGVPLHVHRDEDELFYIVEGELTLLGKDGETVAGAGSFVHLPRGVPHGFANRSGKAARMLVLATPGGALHGVFEGLDAAGYAGPPSLPEVAAVLEANRLQLA